MTLHQHDSLHMACRLLIWQGMPITRKESADMSSCYSQHSHTTRTFLQSVDWISQLVVTTDRFSTQVMLQAGLLSKTP